MISTEVFKSRIEPIILERFGYDKFYLEFEEARHGRYYSPQIDIHETGTSKYRGSYYNLDLYHFPESWHIELAIKDYINGVHNQLKFLGFKELPREHSAGAVSEVDIYLLKK